MDNFDELKTLWQSANTDALPKAGEVQRMAKKFRNERLRKKIMIIALAIVLMAVMIAVMFNYHSIMLSTRLGELSTIAACILLAATNLKSLKRFVNFSDCSNKEFIAFLEHTRMNQLRYYKRTQVIGMFLASAGLVLYAYEFVSHHSATIIITVYGFIVIWILFLWLYIRPRNFKKQTHKLNKMLNTLHHISNQIENEE